MEFKKKWFKLEVDFFENPKIMSLFDGNVIEYFAMVGYYVVIVSKLHDTEKPLPLGENYVKFERIMSGFNGSKEYFIKVLNDFLKVDLLQLNEKNEIYCRRVDKEIAERDRISNIRTEAAKRPRKQKQSKSKAIAKQKQSNSNLLDFGFEPEYESVLTEWFDYKKERKESYKNTRSRMAFYNKLYKMSNGNIDTAKAIIEQSFANNYSGIFDLKKESKQQSKQNGFVL